MATLVALIFENKMKENNYKLRNKNNDVEEGDGLDSKDGGRWAMIECEVLEKLSRVVER